MNQTTLYGIAIEGSDEDDQEYVPQKEDINIDKQLKKEKKKEKQAWKRKLRVQQIWAQMCEETQLQQENEKQIKHYDANDAFQIAKNVLEDQKKHAGKKVKFAGKEFYVNEQGEVREQVEEKVQTANKQIAEHLCIEDLKLSWKYFNNVIRKIQSKSKNINSIAKSKLDWNEFKKKDQMEDKLDKNRKSGGLLEKQRFIEKTRENQRLLRRSRVSQQEDKE